MDIPASPLFGHLPDDAFAHWGRLPVLEQAVLESRQNLMAPESWRGLSLDDPLLEECAGELTDGQAVFNIINIVVGIGVLSVPYALKMSGYGALLVLALVVYIVGTTARWIGASVYLASKSPLAQAVPPSARDFGFLALVAVGPRFQVFIHIVTILEVWLALVTFMVLNGVNAGLVWPWLSNWASIPLLGTIGCGFVFVPPHLFPCLSVISTLAMSVAALSMIGGALMRHHWEVVPFDEAFLNWSNIPRSVGIFVFCFAGHPCFPGIASSMKTPSKWDESLLVSFVFALIYYGGFGILAYFVFGDMTLQTVTNNLSAVEGSSMLQFTAAACFLIKVQLTVPMLLNAVVVAIWPPSALGILWPLGRILVVVVVGTLAIVTALAFASKVAVVSSLCGSMLVMITSVLFPAFVHLTLYRRYSEKILDWRSILRYIFFFVFGTAMAACGTVLAMKDMME